MKLYQEAIAIGKTFAGLKDYQLDGNREMVAIGTMNVVGSLTSCYITTGSFYFRLKQIIYNVYVEVKFFVTEVVHCRRLWTISSKQHGWLQNSSI